MHANKEGEGGIVCMPMTHELHRATFLCLAYDLLDLLVRKLN